MIGIAANLGARSWVFERFLLLLSLQVGWFPTSRCWAGDAGTGEAPDQFGAGGTSRSPSGSAHRRFRGCRRHVRVSGRSERYSQRITSSECFQVNGQHFHICHPESYWHDWSIAGICQHLRPFRTAETWSWGYRPHPRITKTCQSTILQSLPPPTSRYTELGTCLNYPQS